MTLNGKSKRQVEKEEQIEEQLDYMTEELEELRERRGDVKNGILKEKWKKEWWFCNKIEGFPSPSEENALERLNQFVDDYENRIKKRKKEKKELNKKHF